MSTFRPASTGLSHRYWRKDLVVYHGGGGTASVPDPD